MAIFAGNLLPASFRGAPFAVLADDVGGGRRVALHQYPFKDKPWAEDLGRDVDRYRMRGFIVDNDVVFAGGPIQLQRVLLLAALRAKGSGTLTHPTLGILQVSVPRFSMGADLGASRMSTVEIEFVESGKKTFPTSLTDVSGLLSAANVAKLALAVDGVRLIAVAAASGARRQDLANTAATWSSKAITLGADATSLQRLTAQLPGGYGRFSAGGNSGIAGQAASVFPVGTTITDLVAVASGARVNISAQAQALSTASATTDLGYSNDVATAIVALVQALADACADPLDAIRLLEQLIAFDPMRPEATTLVGSAVNGMVRRAAAASLVIAARQYQPTSADDAAAMIARIAGAIGVQADIAADAGDDQSYSALRDARGAVVQDLRSRGATLAQVTTFRNSRALPAVVLAQRYYTDPSRADQLVAQADPINPLFMPTQFQALAA